MKVALLAGANAIHTIRWANGLVHVGIDVHLISAHHLGHELDSRVVLHSLPYGAGFGYFTNTIALKQLLDEIGPDILNAHYASGYGTLARLAGFSPYLLSVWGSDVYDFPEKSPIHHWLIAGNLRAADAVASTSECMLRRTRRVAGDVPAYVTPFGVDESLFCPGEKQFRGNEFVIGTVKTLAPKYGVDTLIDAFAIVWRTLGKPANLYLEVTGDGPQCRALELKVTELGVADQVRFFGRVTHDSVPDMLRRLDVYVALSREESFGVAILEASACGLPVVVSDADGPAEVVLDGETGVIVPRDRPDLAAKALMQLFNDSGLRERMGQAGRQHVLVNYTWHDSVRRMVDAYKDLISKVA